MTRENPSWLPRREELPTQNCLTLNTYSDPSRGETACELMDKLVLPFVQGEKIDFLLVGAGLQTYETINTEVINTFVPYRLAGFLHQKGFDYQATILDISPDVIEQIKRQQLIAKPLKELRYSGSREQWCLYASQLGSTTMIIHDDKPELIFNEITEEQKRQLLQDGLVAAQVPTHFLDKLGTGEIELVLVDIARANLRPERYYFISCENVMEYLCFKQQKWALKNMADSLRPGGILFIMEGHSLMRSNGGWMIEHEARDINLSGPHYLGYNKRDFYFRKEPPAKDADSPKPSTLSQRILDRFGRILKK